MRADQARQIPIHLYLERAGITPAKSVRQGRELWYSSPLREGDETPSFKVDTVLNLWFDHGMARGGNVIDLVIEMRRVTVKEALAILASGFSGSVPAASHLTDPGGAPAVEKEKDSSFEVIDTRAIEHPALLKYLDARCIDTAVARRFLTELRFRKSGSLKTFFALGFASGAGFDARSPVFKGFVGQGKDISRIIFTDRSTVAVFEGPFDFLSWLSMRELVEPDCAVIVLHSVSLKRRALAAITEHGFGRVLLYLDHDQGGRDTTAFFQSELGNRNVVDCSGSYAEFKDLNAWWIMHRSGDHPSGGAET
jgi:hypothetical protein